MEEAGAEAVEVNNMRFATTQTSFLGLISATVVSFVLQNRKSQLHEIVNNTPEGQRLLQEKKRRLEEEAGAVSREDSRVASLAEKVDEDLVVVEASSVGGEENT